MKFEYRKRIYVNYVTGRDVALAPSSLAGLRPRAPSLKKLIRQHFPADHAAAILELGCGHGALIHFARKAGYTNIEGIDGSPEQVAAARRLGIEGVTEGDIADALRVRTAASLDVVVTFDVIEHFTRDELLSIVDDVHRVLRPGGKWIIHTANGESVFSGRMRYGDLTHEVAFTQRSLAQLLLSSGFSSLHCYEDTPVVHGLRSAVRWFFWKLIRGGLRLYIAAETGDASNTQIFTQTFSAVAIK